MDRGRAEGSVIDSAKAIAGLVTNPGAILDYLEVIGKGKQLSIPGSALRCDSHDFRNRSGSHSQFRSRLAGNIRLKVSLP